MVFHLIFQLETLKAQYEEEVEQLRMELNQAKKGTDHFSAADHSHNGPKMDNSHDSSRSSQHNNVSIAGIRTSYKKRKLGMHNCISVQGLSKILFFLSVR